MTALDALLLGLIQGFELLPIPSSDTSRSPSSSSPSGCRRAPRFRYSVACGSLLALLLFYAKTWVRVLRSVRWGPCRDGDVALLPPAVPWASSVLAALDSLRSHPHLLWDFFLAVLPYRTCPASPSSLRIGEALFIGIVQACALRERLTVGMTMAGRSLRLQRNDAVDFGFLMAVPAIAGATLFAAASLLNGAMALPSPAASSAGFLASFGASILAIFALRAFVQRFSTAWFALYLIPLGSSVDVIRIHAVSRHHDIMNVMNVVAFSLQYHYVSRAFSEQYALILHPPQVQCAPTSSSSSPCLLSLSNCIRRLRFERHDAENWR